MWYDKLIQNNSLKQLYRDVPALKDVEINKISLKRDGEEVSIIFELPIYPDNPPEKWNDCNTVSVEISFSVISEFELALKEGYMHGNINISSKDGNLKINISGNLKCSFVAETAVIQRFSAYLKENIDT
jgi:hypothetical protein